MLKNQLQKGNNGLTKRKYITFGIEADDLRTAKKMCIRDRYNTSVTKGNQESHGQNFKKLGKDLMSGDELAVMDGGKCLLQIRGVRPCLSRKYDITKHPNYKLLSDFNEKNAFNIEKFLSTRMPMGATRRPTTPTNDRRKYLRSNWKRYPRLRSA